LGSAYRTFGRLLQLLCSSSGALAALDLHELQARPRERALERDTRLAAYRVAAGGTAVAGKANDQLAGDRACGCGNSGARDDKRWGQDRGGAKERHGGASGRHKRTHRHNYAAEPLTDARMDKGTKGVTGDSSRANLCFKPSSPAPPAARRTPVAS